MQEPQLQSLKQLRKEEVEVKGSVACIIRIREFSRGLGRVKKQVMLYSIYIFAATLLLFMNILAHAYPYETSQNAVVVSIEGYMSNINPGTAECIVDALNYAEQLNSPLIIELDTYGGWLDSAFVIGDAILKAKVPVIGYVRGGKALSAGTLILLPTHIAVMSPWSVIGAMQPIYYDPFTGKVTYVNESKIINPILEKVRLYAGSRGRNITTAERFVKENLVLSADEAKSYGIIDFVASSTEEVLSRINGMKVKVYDNVTYIIRTKSYTRYSCSVRSQMTSLLSDPLISSVLTSIGMFVLILSLISGHLVIAPLGLALLILGLVGSGFNVNLAAIFLVLLGSILLAIELLVLPGFGVVGISGIIMLIFGIALLPVTGPTTIANPEEYFSRLRTFAIALGLGFGSFAAFVVYKVIKAKRARVTIFTLEGKVGRAVDKLEPGKLGYVLIEGEYWKAIAEEPIEPNEEVIVVKSEDMTLYVKKVKRESEGETST